MISLNFNIPEENIHKLDRIISRINKRAKKLNLPPMIMTKGEGALKSLRVETEDILNEYVSTMVFPITLEGENPILSGWRFKGKLDHMPGTNDNIVLGNDVPEKYHNCPPNCDHCGKERARTETFILENIESKELQQVGTSCLKDFFNNDDPMQTAGFLQFLVRIKDELSDLEDASLGNGHSHYRDAVEILSVANTYVRTNGFVSSSAAEASGQTATGHLVRIALTTKRNYPKVTDDDRAKGAKVLEWLKSDEFVSSKGTNEYLHNLAALAAAGSVKTKHIAILASAIVTYDRAMERAKLRADEPPGNYVGVKDERLPYTEVTVAAKIHIPGDNFGDKTLYIMRDADDNRLSWFCTGEQIGSVGDKLHITGTVSKHEPYKGVNQTILKRVVALENKLIEAVQQRKDVKAIAKLFSDPINVDHRYFGSSHDGMTALMVAAKLGDTATVDFLLSKGANPDIKDPYGFTAAHFAASMANVDCLKSLSEWGADFSFVARRLENVSDLLDSAQENIAKNLSHREDIQDKSCLSDLPASHMYQKNGIKISDLGSKQVWTDYWNGAQALAQANSTYFYVPRSDIVLFENHGKFEVLSGHLQIAEASEQKSSHISAYVVSKDPIAVVEMLRSNMEDLSENIIESSSLTSKSLRPA